MIRLKSAINEPVGYRYFVAIGSLVLAVLLRYELGDQPSYLLYLAAVAFCAWYVGAFPAVLILLVSAVIETVYFDIAMGLFSVQSIFGLFVFLSIGSFIVWLNEDRQRSVRHRTDVSSGPLDRDSEFLQKLIDTIPVMITVYHPDTRILRLNPEFERVTGWTSEQTQGVSLMEEIYPDPEYRAFVQAYMDSLQPGWWDIEMRTKSGAIVQSSWANIGLADDTRVGVGIDITARKMAERRAELGAQRAERLLEITSQLATAMTSTEVASIFVTTAATLNGADGGTFVRLRDEDTLEVIITHNFSDETVRAWQTFPLATNAPLPDAIRTQSPVWIESLDGWIARYHRPPSTPNYGAWVGLPLMIEGKAIGGIGFSFKEPHIFTEDDKTFMAVLSAQCAQALHRVELYDRAQQAIQLRDEFMQVAAHELKTPVTSMKGFAQALLRQMDKPTAIEPDRLQRALQQIDQQSTTLTRLLNRLLDASRLETRKLTLELEPTDLTVLVNNAVSNRHGQHHPIVVDAPESVVAVVDPLRIGQVLDNLLDNAIKYSPEGTSVEISLSLRDDKRVSMSIRDYGVGIPPQRREGLFDRFYQAHGAGHLGGLGLGLYVCRQIIEQHHGEIWAEFPADGGTRIIVELPLKQQE